jgi:predicted TIM-barrel fold metal-dependent hydrolase
MVAMTIDIHAHHHPLAYLDALAPLLGRELRGRWTGREDTDEAASVARRIEMMDQAGVATQVLSPMAGLAPYGVDRTAAARAAAVANDSYAELVAAHPDRFLAFASLPLPHLDASLEELARAFDQLGAVGVNLHISVLDRSVAEDDLLPLYEELDRRRAVVFYHPCGNSICSPMIADYGLAAAVGTSLEDATIGLHLIAKRLPARFPDITFVIPHFGGPLPMLLPRLDNQFDAASHDLPEPPSVTARRFYYDTVGHGSAAALACAHAAFGADHLVCGSDYPVLNRYETYDQTINWIRNGGLSEADVEQILVRTGRSILGLPTHAPGTTGPAAR